LVKHAHPLMDATKPAREWDLAFEGERQAKRLGALLRRFVPCRLVTSPEPKALRTSQIVAGELGISPTTVDGLREIDRPVLPIMSSREHERLNARIFMEFDRRIMGRESAREAQTRFAVAIETELARTEEANLVVVAHGTVISLLVSQHDNIDPFELWKRLQCPSFVVLEKASLGLVEIVDGRATSQFQEGGT
jgi:broad specificity phosphatase PhoE